jgi:hypothetical protein
MRTVALGVLPGMLAFVAAVTLPPCAARADGDPASDVLLGESVFYPYSPPVSPSISNTLQAETAAAARAHFPIKVAIIASPVDLGAIPVLFGKPQEYADFLEVEISFTGKQLLLVVMPNGYGVQGLDRSATAAAAALPKPTSAQTNNLARAAIVAVAKLSAAAGHPISGATGRTTRLGGGGSAGSSRALVLPIIALAAVAAAGAVVALRRRRATER